MLFASDPIYAILRQALDTAALRQAVHTANIANADVGDFHRLEVSADASAGPAQTLEPAEALEGANELEGDWAAQQPRVVSTGESVRLDQEMALMAKDALRYQALLGAFERTTGLLDLAVHEGRGG